MSEELKPIRMDGKYQTRDGRAVRVLCVDRKCTKFPVIALIIDRSDSEEIYSFAKNGEYHSAGNCRLDLVEVDEQVRYVNVYPESVGISHDTLSKTLVGAKPKRTGTLKITHINGKLTSVEIVEDAALAKSRGEA